MYVIVLPTLFSLLVITVSSHADSVSVEERNRLLSVLKGFKPVPANPISDPLSDPSSMSLSRLMGEIGKAHVQVNARSAY